jgi:acetyl esterase/lipase
MDPASLPRLSIMPFGYLFPVVLIGFCAAVAIIGPRPPHTTPSFWGYWVTLLINEQPFLAFYALVVATVPAWLQGDLASPGGRVALGLAVLDVVALPVLVRRALRTGPALRDALAEGGIDYEPGPRPWGRILFAPGVVRRRNVARVRNIAYGDAGKRNLLDVYHRRDRPAGAPVFVFFHGGGFRMGSKNREARTLLSYLSARGWVCVNANYRLAPAVHYPDYHVDAKKVIAWVRAHAGEYGADLRTVVASGTSAGAHLASMLGLTPGDPEFQPGFESADTSVTAVVGFSGYYGRVAGPGSSPLDRLGEAPPFLFVHGDKDSLSLVEDTRDFAARLREVSGNEVLLAELPGGQHAFDLMLGLRYSYVIEAVAAFVDAKQRWHSE